jgi:hypothetical protein
MAQIVGLTMQKPPREVVEKLHRALEVSGEMDVDDVCQQIERGKAQLWLIRDHNMHEVYAAALTEVVEYPKTIALRVIALGGSDMRTWQTDLFLELRRFCKVNHIRRIEAICRPGLEKIMKPLGFEKRFVCLFKELENGERSGHN